MTVAITVFKRAEAVEGRLRFMLPLSVNKAGPGVWGKDAALVLREQRGLCPDTCPSCSSEKGRILQGLNPWRPPGSLAQAWPLVSKGKAERYLERGIVF